MSWLPGTEVIWERGHAHPPQVCALAYKAKKTRHVILVGKGQWVGEAAEKIANRSVKNNAHARYEVGRGLPKAILEGEVLGRSV